jgi:hypothetical protein
LAVLFLGPPIAPLLQALGVPLVSDSGALARDLLSRYICPTPSKSYALLGFPMAVCARCWGATIGLWLAWLVVRRMADGGWRTTDLLARSCFAVRFLRLYRAVPWLLRLGLAVGSLLLWTLEINRWPTAPLPALLVNGANGGFWAGVLIGSFWPTVRVTLLRPAA